jgi:hypothetical protein
LTREVCVEVDEGLYGRVQTLRSLGYSTLDILRAGVERLESERLSRLVEYRLLGEEKPFEYRWPNGRVEAYERALRFEVAEAGGVAAQYIVAYGFRDTFGSRRRRVVVFRRSRRGMTLPALVEFAGADGWEASGLVASLIKRPDDTYAKAGEVPRGYEALKGFIRDHGEAIRDGKKGYAALVVREDDYERILYHALRRYEMKRARRAEGW